jgi:hypothetical protein
MREKITYEEGLLLELKRVFGEIPQFVAGNPYCGGRTYLDEEGKLVESGLFAFETEEQLDAFIKANPHCEYVKVGSLIY